MSRKEELDSKPDEDTGMKTMFRLGHTERIAMSAMFAASGTAELTPAIEQAPAAAKAKISI